MSSILVENPSVYVENAPDPAIAIRQVNHYYGEGENRKQVLFENNLTLLPGELVIMTGPSGSGKTTLLTLLGALRMIQEGSIRLRGKELFGLSSQQLTEIRRGIGFIFQAHNLFESLTAQQNVRMALELHSHKASYKKQAANEILDKLGLAERIHYKPRQLSGGQRQRVAIARALVNRPKIILADEPTAALDKESGRTVIESLKELAATEGSTVLVVTHDSRIIDTADRIVNMVDGYIASELLVEETVKICEFLARCPLFQQNSEHTVASEDGREQVMLPNSPELLTEIARKMRLERYASGTDIIQQGAKGDKFYILRNGRVEVLVNENSVVQLGAGEYFGEAALIREEPRNATIRCLEQTDVYSLDKGDFLQAMNTAGTFNRQIRNTVFGRTS